MAEVNPYTALRNVQPEAPEVNPYASFREQHSTPIADGLGSGMFGPNDNKSAAEHTQTAISDAVEWGSSVVVDGGMALMRAVVPEEWREDITDYSREKWDQVSTLPGVEQGIDALKTGWGAYTEWAEENPNAATKLNEVLNVGSIGKSPIRGPKLAMEGRRVKHLNRRESINEIMTPVGKKGRGTIKLNDKNVKVYVPSAWEQLVNDEVVRTAGVSAKKPFTHNYNVLLDKAEKMQYQLDAKITNNNQKVNIKSLKTGLANKVNAIGEDTLLVGNAREQAILIYQQAQKLLDKSDGTSLGVLQARRDLDTWVRVSRPKVFNSDFETATGAALKPIRDAMNDVVATSMKSPSIRDSLTKQHHLLSGADRIEAKAFAEADTSFGRMVEKIQDSTGERLPTTPAAQAMTAKMMASVGGAALVTVVGAYKGVKWLGTNTGRVWLKKMGELAKQFPLLKPEVNALIQLSQGLDPSEREE